MARKSNPNSGCCLSRFLCSGGSQTYPSDRFPDHQISKLYKEPEEKKEPAILCIDETDHQIQASSSYITPSVVAQLMGLDSIPEVNWILDEKNHRAVCRSKSVNFMEYLLKKNKNDEEDDDDKSFKRIGKTSLSFREVPSSARNPNKKHDLLLLYLDKLDDHKLKETKSKSKRFEKEFEELMKRQNDVVLKEEVKETKKCNKKVVKIKDEPMRVHKKKKREIGIKKLSRFVSLRKTDQVIDVERSSCLNSLSKSPTISHGSRRMMRFGSKEDETEIGSDNSNLSPVSVLDLDVDDYLENDLYPVPDSLSVLNSTVGSSPTKPKKKDSNDETDEYMVKLMKRLAELTEEDLQNTTWISKLDVFKFGDVEDVCVDFGQDIIDHVLDQLVDELVCVGLTEDNCWF